MSNQTDRPIAQVTTDSMEAEHAGRPRLSMAIAAELTKVTTLPVALAMLLLTIPVSVGMSIATAMSVRRGIEQGMDLSGSDWNPVNIGTSGVDLAQLLVLLFAVLVVGSEYRSGTISTSLLAVPRRPLLMLARLAAAGGAVALVSLVASTISYLAAQIFLGPVGAPLVSADAVRVVLGATGYLTVSCVLAIGLTTVLRGVLSSAVVLVTLFLVLPMFTDTIPGLGPIAPYLPYVAGAQAMTVDNSPANLSPLMGFLVLILWATVAVAAGTLALVRRDA